MRAVFLAALAIWIGSLLLPCNTATAKNEKGSCLPPYIKAISPRAAKPGDQVIIRGLGFGTKGGEVVFQYKEKHKDKNEDAYKLLEWMVDTVFSSQERAKIVKWTNAMIIVVVPKSATSGLITVSLPCGSVSNKQYFVVIGK